MTIPYENAGDLPDGGILPGPVLPPEVEQALARARVKMRADLERMLAEHGLTPEQIAQFIAVIDEAGEALRRATRAPSQDGPTAAEVAVARRSNDPAQSRSSGAGSSSSPSVAPTDSLPDPKGQET